MSADQHKQIGIRGGARSFQLRGGSIKQNESFEKSQDLKGQSHEKVGELRVWGIILGLG
jgi:hypothetical protein